MTTREILQSAQTARMPLALADTHIKNEALEAMAMALIAAQEEILAANKQDLEAARGRVIKNISPTFGATIGIGLRSNKFSM